MSTGWGCLIGLVVGSAIIAAAIYFGSGNAAMVFVTGALTILTGFLVVIGFTNVRIATRIVLFTGAMERHSDQMRQLTAQDAKVKMIWWDKTKPDAAGKFPFDGEHGKEAKLDVLYIGIPWEYRHKKPGRLARFFGSVG